MSAPPKTPLSAMIIGVIGNFFILAGLVYLMYHYTRPPGIDQARAAERRKNLADLQAQTQDQLNNYAVLDKARGIIRLPIQQAMEITLREMQNPAAARSNLLSHLQRATAPAPNPYE